MQNMNDNGSDSFDEDILEFAREELAENNPKGKELNKEELSGFIKKLMSESEKQFNPRRTISTDSNDSDLSDDEEKNKYRKKLNTEKFKKEFLRYSQLVESSDESDDEKENKKKKKKKKSPKSLKKKKKSKKRKSSKIKHNSSDSDYEFGYDCIVIKNPEKYNIESEESDESNTEDDFEEVEGEIVEHEIIENHLIKSLPKQSQSLKKGDQMYVEILKHRVQKRKLSIPYKRDDGSFIVGDVSPVQNESSKQGGKKFADLVKKEIERKKKEKEKKQKQKEKEKKQKEKIEKKNGKGIKKKEKKKKKKKKKKSFNVKDIKQDQLISTSELVNKKGENGKNEEDDDEISPEYEKYLQYSPRKIILAFDRKTREYYKSQNKSVDRVRDWYTNVVQRKRGEIGALKLTNELLRVERDSYEMEYHKMSHQLGKMKKKYDEYRSSIITMKKKYKKLKGNYDKLKRNSVKKKSRRNSLRIKPGKSSKAYFLKS